MPDISMGPGTKKETIYGGPTPNTGGTVYNGSGTGSTVYSSHRSNATARPAVHKTGGSKGSVIFFIVAGFSALNTLLLFAHAPFVLAIGLAVTRISMDGGAGTALALSAVAIGLFVALGIAAGKGNKTAFLIGMLLYGGDTVVLLLSPNAAAHVPSIVVHGLFIYYMIKALREFGD
ncbi:MAG TPA: hypothetical protein VGK24_07690 [Candidatus Angelobacter sp.]|jgi:hypothetical protein